MGRRINGYYSYVVGHKTRQLCSLSKTKSEMANSNALTTTEFLLFRNDISKQENSFALCFMGENLCMGNCALCTLHTFVQITSDCGIGVFFREIRHFCCQQQCQPRIRDKRNVTKIIAFLFIFNNIERIGLSPRKLVYFRTICFLDICINRNTHLIQVFPCFLRVDCQSPRLPSVLFSLVFL